MYREEHEHEPEETFIILVMLYNTCFWPTEAYIYRIFMMVIRDNIVH